MGPLQNLQAIRHKLAGEIESHGIREVARWADLPHMRVNRFVNTARKSGERGAEDAETLFILAGVLGYTLKIAPGPRHGNQVAIALGLTHKALNPKRRK